MPSDQTPQSHDHFCIVAIGASAGGLQPLEAFFRHIPVGTAAAFVVVQHLSPDVPSLMPELLQQHTDLPVQVIEDGVLLEPGHVFVLPAGFRVALEERWLRLEVRPAEGVAFPIDHLFLSLAHSGRDRLIGILLSGTGSDGTQGLRALSRAGGITLVQSPETTQFAAMVENAIATGVVDQALSPEELAQTVCAIVNYAAPITPSHNPDNAIPAPTLNRILAILQDQEQLDFRQYKPGTLNRRILHRLILSKVETLDDYIQRLERSPEEVKRLGQDLLIGSTRFFRDPELWDYLEQEGLSHIIDTLQPGQPLRMWVTACATGEEAYTLAMVANDVMRRRDTMHPIKIFATDVDVEALAVASRGIYADTITQQISPDRLERYFAEDNHSYIIKPFLRNQIVFAPHDLSRNAGFSQMRLICCRNVLIYMKSSLQQQVLQLLHFSLVPQGYLVLGASEGIGTLDTAYREVMPSLKVFHKCTDVTVGMSGLPRQNPPRQLTPYVRTRPPASQYDRFWGSVLRLGLGDRPITCVLLNGRNQLIHVFLNTAQLLVFSAEEASLTITDMVPPSLKLPLSNALLRIRRDSQPVHYTNIILKDPQPTDTAVNLHVGPAEARDSPSNTLILLLERVEVPTVPALPPARVATSSETTFELEIEASQHIADLESELQQVRDQLQNTIEELETTNEEYQATNEELLASNEELQSTNEELQSLNEELYTLNTENQARIEQLTELNADISNLLSSTDIGVLFLDQHLNIRRFTPAAAAVFSLRQSDIGRPLVELTHRLDLEDLIPRLQQVSHTQVPIEQQVVEANTQTPYLMRMLPYIREDGTCDGVVLTLIDIGEVKAVERELQQTKDLLESIYAASPVGLCLLDANQRYVLVNEILAHINGLTIDEHLGRTPAEVLPALSDRFQPLINHVLQTGEAIYNYEVNGPDPLAGSQQKTWLASYYPVPLQDGSVGVGITVNDITHLKQIQAELAEQRTFAQAIAEATPDIITLFEIPSGIIRYINAAVWRILGLSTETIYQLGDRALSTLIHPDDVPTVRTHFEAMLTAEDGEVVSYQLRILHQDGTWHWFEQRDTVFRRDAQGHPTQLLGVSTDITERVAIQQALERSEALFRTTLEGSQVVVFTQDHDLRYTWIHNPSGNFTQEQVIGKTDLELLQSREQAQRLMDAKRLVLERQQPQRLEISIDLTDGVSRQHFDSLFSPFYRANGELAGVMGVVVDITERKRTELALFQVRQDLEEAQRVAHIGNWQHHLGHSTMQWSQEVYRLLGLPPETTTPSLETWLSCMNPEDRERFLEMYSMAQTTNTGFSLDIQIHRTDGGGDRYLNIIGKPKANASGTVTDLFGTLLDITDRKQNEAALHQQAFYDQLTKLPNRTLFLEQLKQAIRKVQRADQGTFAVLYLDIDSFKEVNDTLGHYAGDLLLNQVAERLQNCTRPGDMVARLGGDEFAMLLDSADQAAASQVSQRIHQAMQPSFDLLHHSVEVTASIGIALYNPENDGSSDTVLLENADIAMYRAKHRGTGQTEVFRPMMRSQDTARIELKTALKQALDRHEFLLYYQPIVHLQTRQLAGFEALLRWQPTSGEILSPNSFLDALRASCQMYPIETWVMQQACQQLQTWTQQGLPSQTPLYISVNLSPASLENPVFVDVVQEILTETQLQPQQLVLEITEHSFINTSGTILQTLVQLRDIGVCFALDDFGTGYASLSCLHQLPITTLKIDRSFVQSLGSDESLQRITGGISALSQALNLQLIAEGIETDDQLSFLTEHGCTYGQGYLFSAPLPTSRATSCLQAPNFDLN